jgi:hypothetical protein
MVVDSEITTDKGLNIQNPGLASFEKFTYKGGYGGGGGRLSINDLDFLNIGIIYMKSVDISSAIYIYAWNLTFIDSTLNVFDVTLRADTCEITSTKIQMRSWTNIECDHLFTLTSTGS